MNTHWCPEYNLESHDKYTKAMASNYFLFHVLRLWRTSNYTVATSSNMKLLKIARWLALSSLAKAISPLSIFNRLKKKSGENHIFILRYGRYVRTRSIPGKRMLFSFRKEGKEKEGKEEHYPTWHGLFLEALACVC